MSPSAQHSSFHLGFNFQSLFLQRLESGFWGDLSLARLDHSSRQGDLARGAVAPEWSNKEEWWCENVYETHDIQERRESRSTHFLQEYLTLTPSCLHATERGLPSLKFFFLPP